MFLFYAMGILLMEVGAFIWGGFSLPQDSFQFGLACRLTIQPCYTQIIFTTYCSTHLLNMTMRILC